ncbi:hypothetical protein [Paraburkholderia sediminicola]|uniref:hypothetical protein n=1 Tax=Paraburkholderia sediminicola TaxID=458836 RepID=UPI0038BC89A0
MKAQLRIGKAATFVKRVKGRASRLVGCLALLVFSALVVWFGISSLQVYGDRLEHVAVVAILLVQGVEIAVYIARYGWLAMFRRAFLGEMTQGKQS